MTKAEIIESIAYAPVADATLREVTDPLTGVTISSFGPGEMEGLKVVTARIFAEVLVQEVRDLADDPSPELFKRLHEKILWFNEQQISGATFVDIGEDVRRDHRLMIKRLRAISRELGISYQEPDDPLLG
ncbi:MAG: hypothetical protein Q7S15_02410 [bacterium]|nr:hypothetical protein [bacterium]